MTELGPAVGARLFGVRHAVVAIGALFAVTGAVGLLLEQVLEKLITTVVGASTHSAAVVLAVYFLGLASGGGLYARLGTRFSRPLVVYGVLEAIVGLWALFIRVFFEPIQTISGTLLRCIDDSTPALLLARFAIACAWILPPTLVMGASFPAIIGALSTVPELRRPRKTLAVFYTLNLTGAIMGTLGGAFWLLPLGGPTAVLVCCFLLETGVFTCAIWLERSIGSRPASGVDGSQRGGLAVRLDRAAVLVLLVGAISGFVFFAFEVVAVHLIGVTVGTSAYAFADMLATILFGLLLSGLGVGFLAPRAEVLSEAVLGGMLAAGALALAITTPYWQDLPSLFPLVKPSSFAGAEAYRGLASAFILLPCAVALGGIYPLLFRLPWFDEGRREALSGALVAANACGCFSGALVSAFVLIPSLGSQTTLRCLALALALGALLVSSKSQSIRVRLGLSLAAAAAAGVVILQPAWDWNGIASGTNVYFVPTRIVPSTPLLFVHEDTRGGVTTVVKPGRERVLLTNGKFQGNDRGETPAQIGVALVPLLHLKHTSDALVIGLGTGLSAAVVADAGFDRIDIAELAPGIVEAARGVLADLNGSVLDRSNVSLHMEDGRNFLLRSRKKYDLITIEISSVWFAGATNLYSREFYETAYARLAPQGVLQQWVQFHHIGVNEVLATLLTLRDVFEHVELYLVGGQGILLASAQPLALQDAAIQRLLSLPSMAAHRAVLEHYHFGAIGDVASWQIYDEHGVDELHERLHDHVRNTDMNRFLEYSTPRHQLGPGRGRENVIELLDLLPAPAAAARRAVLLAERQ